MIRMILIILVVLAVAVPLASAQEGEEPITAVEAIEESEPGLFEQTITWLLATLGAWATASVVVQQTFENAIKPFVRWVLNVFNLTEQRNKDIRTFIIVVGILAAGYIAGAEYNVLAGNPFVTDIDPQFAQIVSGLWLAAGAFGFHNILKRVDLTKTNP